MFSISNVCFDEDTLAEISEVEEKVTKNYFDMRASARALVNRAALYT